MSGTHYIYTPHDIHNSHSFLKFTKVVQLNQHLTEV
jgi:hypothetical protein